MAVNSLRYSSSRTPNRGHRRRRCSNTASRSNLLTSSHRGRVIVNNQRMVPFLAQVTSTRSRGTSKNSNMLNIGKLMTCTLHIDNQTVAVYNRGAARTIQTKGHRYASRGRHTRCTSSRPFTKRSSSRRNRTSSKSRGRNHTRILTTRRRHRTCHVRRRQHNVYFSSLLIMRLTTNVRQQKRPCTCHRLRRFNQLSDNRTRIRPAFITMSIRARQDGNRHLRRANARRGRRTNPFPRHRQRHRYRRTRRRTSRTGHTLIRGLGRQQLTRYNRNSHKTKRRRSRTRTYRPRRNRTRSIMTP